MGTFGFGMLLVFLGPLAHTVELPSLGWVLMSVGAILIVAQVAVGPANRRGNARMR